MHAIEVEDWIETLSNEPKCPATNVSYLYTPALRMDSLVAHRKGIRANVIVVDLEDSIHFNAKTEARDKVKGFNFSALTEFGIRLGLRVNTICSFHGLRDLEMLSTLCERGNCPFEYVFVPKVNHQSELRIYRSLFKNLRRPPKLYAFIETLEAVDNVDGIAAASDALCFGQADLVAEMYTPNSAYLDFARARLCVAAAKHHLQAIDTNSFDIRDPVHFEQECIAAKECGFTGKAAIHPNQVDTINRIFSVTQKVVNDYQSTIDTYHNSESGFALKDGKVIAPPFVARAQMMLNFFEKWSHE